ncbi:MAG: LbtU family siderophore porin [Gammaproteobacteria bacterium]|nr:LbtU family siderophore porin [Gammaproteobacteria bacterium]
MRFSSCTSILLATACLLPFTPALADTTINGAIEVESSYATSYDKNTSSNISVAAVELAIDSQLSDDVFTHLLFLHEENKTPLGVDEATITLRNLVGKDTELVVGQFFVALGKLESYMVSDPLTLQLAETNEGAAQVSAPLGPLSGTIYAFQGKSGVIDQQHDNINKFGLRLEYSDDNLETGVHYISSFADTNGMHEAIENFDGDPDNNSLAALQHSVAGAGVYVDYHNNAFSLVAEYIGALKKFNANDLGISNRGAQPAAHQLELSYFFGKHTFAVGHQGTIDAHAVSLPKSRWMAAASTKAKADTTLALELAHDTDYRVSEGGTGKTALGITGQIQVTF